MTHEFSLTQGLSASGKILGVALLLLTIYPFFSFPAVGTWLLLLAAIYLLLLFFVPCVWLLVLPVATVSLDLATYTGRFLFNELDLLFLVTIGFSLLSGHFDIELQHRKKGAFLIGAYCLVILFSYGAWSVFLSPPGSIESNPYYLPEYGYKVVKGTLWALLLTPFWINLIKQDRQRTINWLLIGQCTAALVLGVIILWERGTLGVILSGSAWYHVVNSLLDLASAYRTTGIFSDMHTGGEVIDGVVLLLLPITLYGLFQGEKRFLRVYSLAAFCSVAYCAMVGFTRATYMSFFLGCGAFMLLSLAYRWRSGFRLDSFPSLLMAGVFGTGVLAAYLSFSRGGSYALAAWIGLAVFALAGARLFGASRVLALIVWPVTAIAMIVIAVNAHFDSRWIDHSMDSAVVIGLVQLVFFLLTALLFVRLRKQSGFNQFLMLVLLVILPSVFAVALGGYKFNERMGTVSEDLNTRMTHWNNVIKSSGTGVVSRMLGNGSGSFPANFAYHFPEVVTAVGSFSIGNEAGNEYLKLGAGEDLAFGQRVAIKPSTLYTLSLSVRAEESAKLAVFVCERNLIFASNFQANCQSSSTRINPSGGKFVRVALEVNSSIAGQRGPLFRWPTIVYVKNFSKGVLVEIDDVVFSSGSENLLVNGEFAGGLDHWFFYNDFAHLPWHVKNIYVQSWYDNGWIGLALFLALGLSVLFVPFSRDCTSSLYVAFSTAVVAIAVFGLFGSPLDSARVSWMFFFYLFISLLRPKDSLTQTPHGAEK